MQHTEELQRALDAAPARVHPYIAFGFLDTQRGFAVRAPGPGAACDVPTQEAPSAQAQQPRPARRLPVGAQMLPGAAAASAALKTPKTDTGAAKPAVISPKAGADDAPAFSGPRKDDPRFKKFFDQL